MSKELEALERIDNTLCLNNNKGKLEFGIDTEEHTDCDSVIGMIDDLETIKQALLKAQEPKHYLKWEDLEFKEEEEIMKVLLNGEKYILKAYKDYILDISIVELEKTDGTFVLYINQDNFQFFNDLRLERVE